MKIKIKGNKYSIDWTYDVFEEIDTDEIFGLEFARRCASWHIVIHTKEKCVDGYFSYDVGHWVDKSEIVRLLQIPEINVLSFTTNNTDGLKEEVHNIYKQLNGD